MFKTDTKIVDMANRVDIVIKNQSNIKGPLTINLHLSDDQTPVEVTLDGKTSSLSPHKSLKFKSSDKSMFMTIIIISFIILLGGSFVTANLLMNHSDKHKKDSEEKTKNVFRIASRDEWLARPASEHLDDLELPVHRVIIVHTATSDCSSQDSCIHQIQHIQNFHMDSHNFKDIAYNFLIGGDGTVYEGRGWNALGAHTKGFNVDSICIAFIGTFNTHAPLEKQLNAGKWIIDEGVRLNKLVKDYRLYGQNQLIGTSSPGMAFYEIIKHWQNWSNNTT